MNILLAYHRGVWNLVGYKLEKFFEATGHRFFVADLEKTPYWTDFKHMLPFYFPKSGPVSIQKFETEFKTKFDIVIEIDGPGQYHLTGMKGLKVPRVLWSMDTHVKAKQKFQRFFQADYDHIFTCHKDYTGIFDKTPCTWLPVAGDPDFHRPLNIPKIYDISFVGNLTPSVYPDRVRILENLSKKYKVGAFQKLFGEEMIKTLNQGKIVFNKSFNGDLNMRVFEALLCGSFLLTERVKNGLFDLFQDGKHLVTYSDEADLYQKADYYLAHEDERNKIAQAGFAEAVAKHTYFHRAKEILQKVTAMKEKR